MNNNNIDYNDLVKSIEHWNEYRVPILKISHPDKNLNFYGAMRFYFQDAGQKVATKCVKVTSNDTTKEVIDILIEKFRPDLRMLSVPEYALYEIHENGDERKLSPDENPLFVQLEWNKDDREGRFLLRRMDEKTLNLANHEEPSLTSKKEQKNSIAGKLYNELPETSFTRSISNPEAVMKRRRAQKLQKPLQQFSLEGGQESGGTLRIFGESINNDISYKTLLLSTRDTASHVVQLVLEKYGKQDDPSKYCLVKLVLPSTDGDNNSVHDMSLSVGLRESILDDNDCPLFINQTHDKSQGILTFHIRQKPADYQKRRKKKSSMVQGQGNVLSLPPVASDKPTNHQANDKILSAQQYYLATGANDKILPALIQVREDVENIFLNRVITHLKPTDVPFRLAPTYVLYMVSRYRASTLFHPELQAPSRAELFMPFTRKIAIMIRNTIEAHARDPTYLAFWLANSSDLSHFYKQDKHLSHFTIDAQEILYDSIKASFKYLLSCKQLELDAVLHSFFDERDDNMTLNSYGQLNVDGMHTAVDPILDVLNDTMSTMRKNRVNAALTIQIFSHLFHHIGKWLFDRLIGVYDDKPGVLGNQPNFKVYCNRIWGEKLHHRLSAINNWAERQGLEQAAEFHLARVTQTTLFLAKRYPPRITPRDLKESCDKCDRLNPIQMRALLRRYKPDQNFVSAIIETFLYQMDYTYMAGDYPLEEDFDLKIPFLIPEDGYSSELIRYIPNYLLDFVSYLSKIRVKDQELCIFTVQPTSSGHWTVYFKNHQPDAPEIIVIQLRKKGNSMGLSIIAARGVGQERLGIYIKNVVKDGAAAMDGRLQAGDQLLEVDGNSLLDITQEQAAGLMVRTGPIVTLKIAKQAAIYHNVSDIINSVPAQTVVTRPQPHHQQPPYQPPQQNLQQVPMMPPPQAFVQQSISIPPLPPVPIKPLHQQPPYQPQQPTHLQPQPAPMMPPPQAFVQQSVPIPPLPSVPIEPLHQQPTNTMQSPMKSPKKVSWVDTKPHQSLHTLIPLPQEPEPTDILQSTTNGNEDLPGHTMEGRDNYDRHNDIQHRAETRDDDENEEDDDEDSTSEPDVEPVSTNGQSHTVNGQDNSVTNGLADTTAESLTLEDIDEVLSSKQTNNWLEDSAGVIGTQEVYNDPRQRIVKERERIDPSTDVNIEKLSFQEKLKMFNISAKK